MDTSKPVVRESEWNAEGNVLHVDLTEQGDMVQARSGPHMGECVAYVTPDSSLRPAIVLNVEASGDSHSRVDLWVYSRGPDDQAWLGEFNNGAVPALIWRASVAHGETGTDPRGTWRDWLPEDN